MSTKKFPKEGLKGMLWDDSEILEVIENNIVDTSRWSVIHGVVFKEVATGNFYGVSYSEGATEIQDESPFEYDDDEIECEQVEPTEVTVIKYQPVNGE